MQSKPSALIASNQGMLLWLFGLLPFVVMHTVSAIYIQVRGITPNQIGLSALGYFLGLISSIILLPLIETKISNQQPSGKYWHLLMLAILLLPGGFSLLALVVMEQPHVGNYFLNVFQPFLWALLLPVAFRLFFHPILTGMHGLFFGVVSATGHLCLAFLNPIINLESASSQLLSTSIGNPYLSFLNVTRSIFGIAFALIAWWFISFDAAESSNQTNSCALNNEDLQKNARPPIAALWPFLLPLTVCFFLYGFPSQRHYELPNIHQFNAGYMHIGLAILSLAIGFIITKKGIPALKIIIKTSLLFLVLTSLIFYFFEFPPLAHIVNFLYDASNQILLFSATLVCGYTFLQNRSSSLAVAIFLFSASAPILGVLLEKYFPVGLPTNIVISVLLAGCALSAWFSDRFFVLLMAIPQEKILDNSTQENTPTHTQKYTTENLSRFAALHKLNNREIQIMELLLRGLTSLEMVEIVGLKQSTVRTYTQNLLKKTGTNSRLELVAIFMTWPDK